MAQMITVNSRKYDGSIRRSWTCELADRSETILTLTGIFADDIRHDDLGLIKKGTISFEFYWLDRWYNVFRFHEPDGALRNYYCNVSMPPSLGHGVLDYIDLDIDVVVWPDHRYEVLDLDDFEKNAFKYDYPKDVVENAGESLAQVVALIENGDLP